MRFAAAILLSLFTTFSSAQSLEFLGLSGIRLGMPLKDLQNPQLMLDTSSAYKDTALYIKMTRCHMYYSKTQNLALKGFSASRVEYEFCDSLLGYVFVYINGKQNIDSALALLKKSFPKLGCGKGVSLASCGLMDTRNKEMRLIVRVNSATNEMNLVLIPRKSAG